MRSIFLLVFGLLLSLYSQTAFAADPMKQTTLRAVGEPKGTFRSSSSGTSLRQVELQVRNVGSVPAESVKVEVIIPGGTHVSLKGPDTLAPNASATYSTECQEKITTTERLKPSINCSNCR